MLISHLIGEHITFLLENICNYHQKKPTDCSTSTRSVIKKIIGYKHNNTYWGLRATAFITIRNILIRIPDGFSCIIARESRQSRRRYISFLWFCWLVTMHYVWGHAEFNANGKPSWRRCIDIGRYFGTECSDFMICVLIYRTFFQWIHCLWTDIDLNEFSAYVKYYFFSTVHINC